MISIIHTFDMEAGKPFYKPPLKGINSSWQSPQSLRMPQPELHCVHNFLYNYLSCMHFVCNRWKI